MPSESTKDLAESKLFSWSVVIIDTLKPQELKYLTIAPKAFSTQAVVFEGVKTTTT